MPFIRIARVVRPQSRSRSARAALPRAFSRSAGAQASSRSRNTRSAPEVAAFANMSSLLAGVASSERRGRGLGGTSDHSLFVQFVQAVIIETEQLVVDLGVVLPEPRAEVSDGARGGREAGNGRLDAHRAEFRIRD